MASAAQASLMCKSHKNQQGIQNKSIAIAVTWLMPDKSLDIVADKIRKII